MHYARQWEAIVGRIREISGFERFLLPLTFNDLQQAAARGPVILINISDEHSDSTMRVPLLA